MAEAAGMRWGSGPETFLYDQINLLWTKLLAQRAVGPKGKELLQCMLTSP